METWNRQVLISEHESEEETKEWMCQQIKSQKIKFPYQVYFCDNYSVLYENLKKYRSQVLSVKYELNSYCGKYFLPPTFRKKFILIKSSENTYISTDVITSIFTEDIRIQASKKGILSPESFWFLHTDKIVDKLFEYDVFSSKTLREILLKQSSIVSEFRCSWGRELLFRILENRRDAKVLDISAGWGDRLIAAISLNYNYQGYDPNIKLKRGHDMIIKCLGDKNKHKIEYVPFENAEIISEEYDIVLSSLPPFDLEKYSSNKSQSIERYPQFQDWIINFVFVSVYKSYIALKHDGYLVIHVVDPAGKQISEIMNLYIETFPGISYEGVIGIVSNRNNYPVWVWKKDSAGRKWNSKIKRSLQQDYPEFF